MASQDGHPEVARLLLESRADKDLARTDGATALVMASQHRHLEVVHLLLETGADNWPRTSVGLQSQPWLPSAWPLLIYPCKNKGSCFNSPAQITRAHTLNLGFGDCWYRAEPSLLTSGRGGFEEETMNFLFKRKDEAPSLPPRSEGPYPKRSDLVLFV